LVEGRIYVINLNRLKWTGLSRRVPRAIKHIEKYLLRHTKADKIIIDSSINEYLHSRSHDSLPSKIAVTVVKLDSEGKVLKATLCIPVEEKLERVEVGSGGSKSEVVS